MSDEVKLKIGGVVYEGWQSVSITRNLSALCASFDLGLTEDWSGTSARRPIQKGAACEVWIDDDMIVTGWIDQTRRHINDREYGLSAIGRDKTCDLIDCSAIHKPGSWRGQKLEKIATDLTVPFGLTVKVQADTGAVFAHFALEQGETVFEALTRLCRLRGLLLDTDHTAALVVHSPKPQRRKMVLKVGGNVLSIEMVDDGSEQFSEYTFKGQQRGGNWVEPKDAAAVKATAKDAGVTRHRPYLGISDDQSTSAGLTARAKWEATTRNAKAQSVTVQVRGWRDEEGRLWAPNTLYSVSAPAIGVEMELMVSEVFLTIDQARIATLTLVRPEAFTTEVLPEPKPDKKGKKATTASLKGAA